MALEARRRGCHVALKAGPASPMTMPHAHALLDSGAITMLFVNELEVPSLLQVRLRFVGPCTPSDPHA